MCIRDRITSLLAVDPVDDLLRDVAWHSSQSKFYRPDGNGGTVYFEADGQGYRNVFETEVNQLAVDNLDSFDELVIRANLMLIRDLIYGAVQFEHIQPLMKRIDSSVSGLKKILTLTAQANPVQLLTIVSLRKCNQEMKKILPLLIAKHYYHLHKDRVENPPNKTMHLIIDEAHNILSQQSSREHEIWKDYRLELFLSLIHISEPTRPY